MSTSFDYKNAVESRYSVAATKREEALCCPIEYNDELLQVIPAEILERDYGCGNPTPFVELGDTVLDLGSGGGKLCYIASQLVGPDGFVIGVDCNSEMLNLARKYQQQVANQIGFDNVSFRCGMIQNLRLDLEKLAEEFDQLPQTGVDRIFEQKRIEKRLLENHALIESNSVDCVVSNCVLNLVNPTDREQLFAEVYRVLKNGGRVAISDIVADEDVPESMKNNPELWSGCISGAWREDQFIEEFEKAGFHGISIVKREPKPWQTVEGIEFRSITVLAYKGKDGPCLERNQAVVYRGPFKKVEDDYGHIYFRGQRMAVCDKTFKLLQRTPYGDSFIPVEPLVEVPLDHAQQFDCNRNRRRSARESKGEQYNMTTSPNDDSCSGESCC